MRRLLLASLSALLLLAGCGGAPPPSAAVEPAPEPATSDGQGLALGRIGVLDAAPSSKILGCSGICVYQWGFWVDLTVANEAFTKEVGVVWTRDGWRSQQTALAKYERALPGGREQWGVDVDLGQGMSGAPEVEYAVYVKMNGATTWDPFNNHFIRDSVTASRPVRLLRSGLTYESARGVVLSGDVRVLDVAFEKRVQVRYTTNGWKTWTDADAGWVRGQDWHFEVGLGTPAPLPDGVDFAVRLRSGGVDAWDSKGGANHHHDVRPVFTPNFQPTAPLAGIITLGGNFKTDLPRFRVSTRLDGQPFGVQDYLTFSTLPLTDGAHTAQFRFEAQGGYREVASLAFGVKNRVTPLSAWTLPTVGPDTDYPWDGTVGADGKVYVLWSDGSVARSESAGSATPPFVYPRVPSAHRIAVDASGRLYVLVANNTGTLTRLLPSGAADPSFGAGGTVTLNGTYAGSAVCFAGYVAVAGPRIIVSDTCNERLLVFDEAATLRQTLQLPPDFSAVSHQVFFDGAKLWVPSWSRVLRYRWTGSAFTADGQVPLPDGVIVSSADGVALANGLLWIIDGNARLLAVNPASGALEATWRFGEQKLSLLGEASLPRAMALLPDGTLGVTAATSKTFERFSTTLK